MRLKVSSAKRRPFGVGLNVLTLQVPIACFIWDCCCFEEMRELTHWGGGGGGKLLVCCRYVMSHCVDWLWPRPWHHMTSLGHNKLNDMPPLPSQPTLVLLIAYMRGGSSFFGSTFSMNPDVFYWYEPVWELYNSMAAVHGVELPIHSLYYPDGRERYVLHMMTSSNGNIFRVTGLLCGEFTGDRWIPRTKASDAELWCFRWSACE